MSSWLFADPEDRCHNICFPRIPLRGPGGGRFSGQGLVFFSGRFDLSSKGRLMRDAKCETKKAK
jgi:hypothetical protein